MTLEEISNLFLIEGEYLRSELITDGHINSTYRVFFLRHGEEKDYIIQKINKYVFKKPEEVMENIFNVTEYIRNKIKSKGMSAKRYVLHFQKTVDGKYFIIDETGEYWRCSRFIDDCASYNETADLKVIEESGKAFGEFQGYLADFDVKKLHITIPHFHNTPLRYETFKKSLETDTLKRKQEVSSEIKACLKFEELAEKMYRMQRAGELPLKVTHNDTKCNNVLFDAKTSEHLSVIDLDTVMPGLIAFDFGDAIRFIGNNSKEDEIDLNKVYLNMDKYEAFAKGFIGMVGETLTEKEIETMALGAFTMTVECGMRFLTDYLDGDKYFKINYSRHNLDRARSQFKLATDILSKLSEMEIIVKKYC